MLDRLHGVRDLSRPLIDRNQLAVSKQLANVRPSMPGDAFERLVRVTIRFRPRITLPCADMPQGSLTHGE